MAVLRVLKQKRFILGFIILFAILFCSFTLKSLIEPHFPIKAQYWLYGKGHMLIGRAPFPPSHSHPLGSDSSGVPFGLILLAGAKYTIGIAFGVAGIRFVGGLLFGVILSFFKEKPYAFIYYLLNTFNYIPETFLAFVILAPIDLVFVWNFSIHQQVLITFIALAILGIPNLTVQLSSEIRQVKTKEFVEVAETMGGGPFHILSKHVKPFLNAKMVILIKQQLIQVLVVIVALAILGIRVAGATQQVEPPELGATDPAMKIQHAVTGSATSEWGGLIQQYRDQIWGHRWMIYEPALAFCITIICIQIMASAILRVIQGDDRKYKRKRKRKRESVEKPESVSFEWVNKETQAS
jgi:peptide/nickel transport system permease protein